MGARFVAYGWQVLRVSTSEDVEELAKAIKEAKREKNRPSLIIVPTHIGFGSPRRIWPVRTANRWALRMWLPLKKPPVGIRKSPSMCLMKCGLIRRKIPAAERKEAEWEALLDEYAKKYPDLAADWWTA